MYTRTVKYPGLREIDGALNSLPFLPAGEVCGSEGHRAAVRVLPAHTLPVEGDGLLPLLSDLRGRCVVFKRST